MKFVSRKVVSFLNFLVFVCLLLEKLINGKHFPVKGKFCLVSRKVFSFYFRRKTLSRSCEKFRNVMLFANYIKFGPQTFDYYIFCFEFFLISSLTIWFNLIFISTLVLIFMIAICFSLIIFLIKIFYLLDLVLILLIIIYFIWNNLWNCNFFKISSSFNFFYLLDLIFIILIVIYFIWDNLWN